MSESSASLYTEPRLYDAVFGTSNREERAFLEECFSLHATRPVRRVFEPATGSGRLLVELARAGFDVSGCDLSAAAAAYANRRLQRLGRAPSVEVFDMTQFHLPRKVDAAYNLISSFQHLNNEAAAGSHLQSVAANLARGGLYVLGLQLLPTQGRRSGSETWTGKTGATTVTTFLKTIRLDRRQRVDHCRMTTQIRTGRHRRQITEWLRFRTYTWAQLRRLLRQVPAFEIAATYDFTYNIADPIRVGPRTQDAIFVLRRR